jgi:Carboxypeptidase regulatory-like domain
LYQKRFGQKQLIPKLTASEMQDGIFKMKGKRFDVNSLRIASPCSVGWENMSGDERTRHCDQCSLNVYNISALTVPEVESLILKREGRLCIRMYRRADGTVSTKDCPVGLRAVQKRVARFAGATLAAVLGLFSISFGQKTDDRSIDASKAKIVRSKNIDSESELTGIVVDKHGAVIPNATIKLSSQDHTFTLASNGDGAFDFSRISLGTYSLSISSPGFSRYELKNLLIGDGERLELNVVLKIDREKTVTVGLLLSDGELETESSMIQTTFTTKQINSIPH